jgi:Protein kinase domain
MRDHPNIAKVLAAGATEAGRPFFVMELVPGIKFTEYCDQNKLPTPERLKLFTQVCNAIQHAHQKEIIHRDIKPSNKQELHQTVEARATLARTTQLITERFPKLERGLDGLFHDWLYSHILLREAKALLGESP